MLLLGVGLVQPLRGVVAEASLTLVKEAVPGKPGKFYGVMDIAISGAGLTRSTAVTELTGTVSARLDVDHALGGTSELTLRNGRIRASDFSLAGRAFVFFSYNAVARNLAATLSTVSPPGVVAVTSGAFAAAQHRFTVDEGTVAGTAAGETFNQTFSEANPFEGPGSGQGIVSLTRVSADAIYQTYRVEVVLPGVSISDTITAGTVASVTATVTGTGDIKARGTVRVPRSDYLAWTVEQGLPGVAGDADENGDGIANALAWALRLPLNGPVAQVDAPRMTPEGGFTFKIPTGGSPAEIRLQHSTTLGNWVDLPAQRISRVGNPLPVGSAGVIQVPPVGQAAEFFRLAVDY